MVLNDTDTPVAYTTYLFANYNGYGAEVPYVGDLAGGHNDSRNRWLVSPHSTDGFWPSQCMGSGRVYRATSRSV
jgi:hypothetical protein